jgi:hypothetical protein
MDYFPRKSLSKYFITDTIDFNKHVHDIDAVTSYRGERFQVPTRLTTVTRQTGEYKVDLTRHPKFLLALFCQGRFHD